MSSVLAKQDRLKAIQAHIEQLTNMDSEAVQNGDFDAQFESLYAEMYAIKDELAEADKTKSKIETAADSIGEMAAVMNGLKNHPVEYNDLAVRQLIECIKVMSADTLHIYFKDGTRIEATLQQMERKENDLCNERYTRKHEPLPVCGVTDQPYRRGQLICPR